LTAIAAHVYCALCVWSGIVAPPGRIDEVDLGVDRALAGPLALVRDLNGHEIEAPLRRNAMGTRPNRLPSHDALHAEAPFVEALGLMYEMGVYGIPGRFSHWTHGKAYWHMKTMYDYGLSKIYELVINTNPSMAFLLENNSDLENKMVMAHVLATSSPSCARSSSTSCRRCRPRS